MEDQSCGCKAIQLEKMSASAFRFRTKKLVHEHAFPLWAHRTQTHTCVDIDNVVGVELFVLISDRLISLYLRIPIPPSQDRNNRKDPGEKQNQNVLDHYDYLCEVQTGH